MTTYVEKVGLKGGEYALVHNGKRTYFDFNPNYYGVGEGSITNSLKKKFPIPRSKVIQLTEKLFQENHYQEGDALGHAVSCFHAGAVDSVWWNGKILLSQDWLIIFLTEDISLLLIFF